MNQDIKESNIRKIDRYDQYDYAAKIIKKAKKHLLIIEKSPSLIESNDISGLASLGFKAEFKKVVENAVKEAIASKLIFYYLFDHDQTRKDLSTHDSKSRNEARHVIYRLKSSQESSSNFRFDPVQSQTVSAVIVDDLVTYYIDGGPKSILEISIKDPELASHLLEFYSLAPVTDDDELCSMLELGYDDRDRVVLVNERDDVIGTTTRPLAHEKSLLHRGVHLEVSREDGSILICKRSPVKATEPNKWDFSVSGHCAPEDYAENEKEFYFNCLVRECNEEIGLDITHMKDMIEEVGKRRFHTRSGENVRVMVYRLRLGKSDLDLIRPSEEISKTQWVTKDELTAMAHKEELADWYREILVPLDDIV